MQDEDRENEAVEPVEETVEEEAKESETARELHQNPDIEDPRLYSPLLDSSAPALKERTAEEPHEQEEELENSEVEVETEGEEEECCEEETASEKINLEDEEY
jgi:hypothetical protein